jgi:hypothetical protein
MPAVPAAVPAAPGCFSSSSSGGGSGSGGSSSSSGCCRCLLPLLQGQWIEGISDVLEQPDLQISKMCPQLQVTMT